MTAIEPGKRYRLTFDVVADPDGPGRLTVRLADGMPLTRLQVEQAVSVERLPDPLPTTPGSVIVDGGVHFMRTHKGWIGTSGTVYPIDTDGFTKDFTVIHDAGAES